MLSGWFAAFGLRWLLTGLDYSRDPWCMGFRAGVFRRASKSDLILVRSNSRQLSMNLSFHDKKG